MKVYEPIKPSNFNDKFDVSLKLNQIIENMIKKIHINGFGLMIGGNKY